MRTMNCQKVRHVIEATDRGDHLNVAVAEHIKRCAACEKLNDEHLKLRTITANLGVVEAPADFDFRLRARIARANAEDVRPAFGRLSFGFRSVAFASLMVVFAGAMLIANLRTAPQGPTEAPAVNNPIAAATPFQQPTGTPSVTSGPVAVVKPPVRSVEGSRRVRTGSRDMASRRAPVQSSELIAQASDFSIDASSQPVKVSVDDGRGSSRTISVPTVSFGSQRVLSGNSPLVASARGAW